MYSEDDIQFAIESTEVLHEPDRRIDTFGSTKFEFFLITEMMDSVNEVRVRNGTMTAEKPQILRPEPYSELSFEGFGDQAEQFAEWLRDHGHDFSLLRYGFNFRRDNVSQEVIRDDFGTVRDRVLKDVHSKNDPMHAVISGVDDAWEICLLKFTVQMIEKSHGINVFDFKRRGLL